MGWNGILPESISDYTDNIPIYAAYLRNESYQYLTNLTEFYEVEVAFKVNDLGDHVFVIDTE